ncbi:hypothetical protein, partial [Haladaptatus sp. NG-SE-30]
SISAPFSYAANSSENPVEKHSNTLSKRLSEINNVLHMSVFQIWRLDDSHEVVALLFKGDNKGKVWLSLRLYDINTKVPHLLFM